VSERLPSDHPSVETHRARLARVGGTRRPCLRVPDPVDVEPGTIVRLVLDGTTRHARVDEDASGPFVQGAYDNRTRARERVGENRLVEWARAHDREPGDAVEFDVVEPGFCYGLRIPGARTVYEAVERPDDSLSSIAESLADRE
jgi:hypothetical protein